MPVQNVPGTGLVAAARDQVQCVKLRRMGLATASAEAQQAKGKRNPSSQRELVMGFARAQPILQTTVTYAVKDGAIRFLNPSLRPTL